MLESRDPRFVRHLSPEDLSILALENDVVAGHTCKVILLAGGLDPDRLRASIASRLDRAPEMSMRLADVDARPSWVLDPAMDMSSHVVVREVPAPPGEAELRRIVGEVFRLRLDRSRPLWRIDVLPELKTGGSALIWRIHHALADGSTAMRMAGATLWDTGVETGVHASRARDQPGSGPPGRPQRGLHEERAHGHRLRGLLAAAREAPQPWLRSPFDGRIGSRRAVGFASAPLDSLRQVAARTNGATVNDAVLTVVAGGLRRWLEASYGHLGTVRVKVPVSLHGATSFATAKDAGPGNRDSFFCLDLPLKSADPIARLGAVRRETRVRKEGHDAQYLDALMRELRHVPQLRRFAERVLAHPRSFALNVSNVPGPRQPVGVLGVPVRALYSLAEIREHHALRIAVASLGNTLNFGLSADPTLVPRVDRLAEYMQIEARALTSAPPPM